MADHGSAVGMLDNDVLGQTRQSHLSFLMTHGNDPDIADITWDCGGPVNEHLLGGAFARQYACLPVATIAADKHP